MNMLISFFLWACQTEHLERTFHMDSSSEDPRSKLQPYLDQMFDPMDDGFDADLVCNIEEWLPRHKKDIILDGEMWWKDNHTNYETFFVSDIEGVIAEIHRTPDSALNPIFWDRLSFGEHWVSFIVFEEGYEEALCLTKINIWSTYME